MRDASAVADVADVGLTDRQNSVVMKDLGLVGSWWAVLSAPRAFFLRAGIHAGNYGDELLVASGRGVNPFIFFFVVQIATVIIAAALSGSLAAGAGMIVMQLVGVIGLLISFYVLSGICHVLAKILRCQGDFDAAQSLVAFSSAPQVFMAFGSLAFGLPAAAAFLYGVVLQFFGFRYIYRASVIKALVLVSVVTGLTVAIRVVWVSLQS